jgi:hypothetical protein
MPGGGAPAGRIPRCCRLLPAVLTGGWLLIAGCATSRLMVSPGPDRARFAVRSDAGGRDLAGLLRNGEFERAEDALVGQPLDSSAVVAAVQGTVNLFRGNPALAEQQLRRVFYSQADSALRRLAYFGLQTIVTEQQRYAALETIEARAQADGISTDTSSLTAAQALHAIGTSRFEFRGAPAVAMAMRPAPLAGCPTVRARVNGRGSEQLWMDTGASLCVISDDLVSRLGVRVLDAPMAEAGTATQRKVKFRFGVLDSLELDRLVVYNVPVAVMRQSDLNLGIPFLNIPGIIGWPVLDGLRTTIDYAAGQVTFEQPVRRAWPAPANLLYFGGVPVVRVAIDSTGPMHFIFDTGAQMSLITWSGLDKLLAAPAMASSPGCIGGAGGGDARNLQIVRGVVLTLAGQNVHPVALPVHKLPTQDFPLAIDGLVGENVLQRFRVELDPLNRAVRLFARDDGR